MHVAASLRPWIYDRHLALAEEFAALAPAGSGMLASCGRDRGSA